MNFINFDKFDKNELDYTRKTIENYFYLKKKEQYYRRLAFEKQLEIDDSMRASGISYDKIPNTHNNTDTPADKQRIHEQHTYDIYADECKRKYESLDKQNHITERLDKLSADYKRTIIVICKHRKSVTDYAKEQGVSRQAIQSRLDNALEKFMEVK